MSAFIAFRKLNLLEKVLGFVRFIKKKIWLFGRITSLACCICVMFFLYELTMNGITHHIQHQGISDLSFKIKKIFLTNGSITEKFYFSGIFVIMLSILKTRSIVAINDYFSAGTVSSFLKTCTNVFYTIATLISTEILFSQALSFLIK